MSLTQNKRKTVKQTLRMDQIKEIIIVFINLCRIQKKFFELQPKQRQNQAPPIYMDLLLQSELKDIQKDTMCT